MRNVRLITRNLLEHLVTGINDASSVNLLVSFAMTSGVHLLVPHLQRALDNGCEVKILIGDYLYVTQPAALRLLATLNRAVEVRLWQSRGLSFHPKAYLIDRHNGAGLLIVGSSNLSGSALGAGVEWNLAMDGPVAPETFGLAMAEFTKLFYNSQTVPVNTQTIADYDAAYHESHHDHPETARRWAELEEITHMLSDADQAEELQVHDELAPYHALQPRPVQTEALEQLGMTMEEGYDKALVVMATGLGKTYLAAFFAKQHGFRRILFVAHREEILQQARTSFLHVMPARSTGIYDGSQKDGDADLVFASIFTLSMARHRTRFRSDAFDLVIVDEFHHAAAQSYQHLLEYFRPKLLLGITATPDRADGRDIYGLCDGNVAYQIQFVEAIQRGWLSPFHYYGVYDDIDYTHIHWRGTHYDEEELLTAQLRDEHAEQIWDAWEEHRGARTLVFCSSVRQADFLSDVFQHHGTRSISLHSRTTTISRSQAIQRLANGSLDVIFTVDLFNEGVDIPAVDTLLFVRPTESLTVFVQQIGRGLRLHPGKSHCTIIDLIGNYRNADVKLRVFDAAAEALHVDRTNTIRSPFVPEGCRFQLDAQVVDLLKVLTRKRSPRRDALLQAFQQLKRDLGHRPTYLELHLYGRADSRIIKQEFASYVGFLAWADQLSPDEVRVFHEFRGWIEEVERTGMVKSYKMILLLYMLERDPADWMKPVSATAVAPFFHAYLTEKEYRKRIDFSDKSSQRLWNYHEEAMASLIGRMPMKQWSSSSRSWVGYDGDQFGIHVAATDTEAVMLHSWTAEICVYRLHAYFERKGGRYQ